MSSNEEYLDQLLKAVEERESADDALTRLQEETRGNSSNYTLPQEEEDILAELLAAGTEENGEEISLENEDISESLLDELVEDIPTTGTSPAGDALAEEEESIFTSAPELIEVEEEPMDFSVDHSSEDLFFEPEEDLSELLEEDTEEGFTGILSEDAAKDMSQDFVEDLTEDLAGNIPEDMVEDAADGAVETWIEEPMEIPAEDPMESLAGETLDIEGTLEEMPVAMEPEDMVPEALFSEAESASAQDVDAGEESEDEYIMSEEDIDALLSAAKESAEAELRETTQGSKEMEDEGLIDDNLDDEDFSGLFEVDDLGMEEQQTDLLDDPDNFDNYLVEEDLLEEQLQLQEETAKKSRKEKKKDKKKKERVTSNEEDGEEKKGLFGKLFHFLMEEVEDPLEAEQTNLSEENKEILSQLDKEKEEKRKAAEEKKKLKKEEKEKKKQENKAKKEARQKVRKEKKEQARAAKAEKAAALPAVKPLPKKKVIISFIFSFSLMAVILLAVFLLLPQMEIAEARGAYERGDYAAAYEAYYGNKLKEEDSNRFYAAETILRMERNLDAYYNYVEMQDVTRALHSLIRGVVLRDEILRDAESYGVVSQVESTYAQIAQILNQDYNLSEEAAKSIAAETSDVTYTKMLEAIASGTEYVEEVSEPEESTTVPQEDLLPEEEELFRESAPASSEPAAEEGGQVTVVGSETNL